MRTFLFEVSLCLLPALLLGVFACIITLLCALLGSTAPLPLVVMGLLAFGSTLWSILRTLVQRWLAADLDAAKRRFPVLAALFGFTAVLLYALGCPHGVVGVTAALAVAYGLAGLSPLVSADWSVSSDHTSSTTSDNGDPFDSAHHADSTACADASSGDADSSDCSGGEDSSDS